jgi:hypothetical protein
MQPQYYPQPPPPQQQYNPQQGQPQFQGQQPQFYAAPPPQYGGQQPQYMPVQPQAARTWAGGLFGCCGARALAWGGGGGQAVAFYPVLCGLREAVQRVWLTLLLRLLPPQATPAAAA